MKKIVSLSREDLNILLLTFTFGGIFGFIYEEIFYYIDLGYLVKRGTTFGPWIPIYGIGAVLIILATERYRSNPGKVFLISAFLTGLLEFATGYLLYHLWSLRLWDYNVEIWNWGNIGGYICFRSVAFFGVSAIFLQYMVHPMLHWIHSRWNSETITKIAFLPAFFFIFDIVISLLISAR